MSARPRCNDPRCGRDLVVCGECAPWVARQLRFKAQRFEKEAPELDGELTKAVAAGLRARADVLDTI